MKPGDLVRIRHPGPLIQYKYNTEHLIGKIGLIIKVHTQKRFKSYKVLVCSELLQSVWQVDLEAICELED